MSVFTVLRNFVTLSTRNNANLKTACACYNHQRFYSAKSPQQKIVKEIDPITGEVKKKKTGVVPKITLLSGESLSVTTLQEAENISKRRDLKLVKIVDLDTKTQRPVYKLMTGAEYHAEDLKHREQKKKDKQSNFLKGEKLLMLNTKISEHDLATQLKKISKWLDKMYEVRVVINMGGTSIEAADKLYSSMEKYFKESGSDAKLVQKRQKGNDVKFQILPPKKKGDDSNDNL